MRERQKNRCVGFSSLLSFIYFCLFLVDLIGRANYPQENYSTRNQRQMHKR